MNEWLKLPECRSEAAGPLDRYPPQADISRDRAKVRSRDYKIRREQPG
jgi:hypothetical protein